MNNIETRIERLEKHTRDRRGILLVVRNDDETEDDAMRRHFETTGVRASEYQCTVLLDSVDMAL